MSEFFRRALMRVASAAGDARVIVLTAKARPADFDARLADRKSPDFCWVPGDLANAFDAWSMAGDGETLRVDAASDERWDRVREASHAAMGRVIEEREDGVVAPDVRWLGGGSFHAGVRDSMWTGFGAASFVVPRWSIGKRGEDAFVRFAFRTEELDRPEALLAEIDSRPASSEEKRADSSARAISASALPDADFSWAPLVERALADIEHGSLQKVVVARRASIRESVSPSATLARLRTQNPSATSFSVRRNEATFLGATPERLIFSNNTHAFTEALAGTIARRAGDDERAKADLLASEKDLREHEIVVRGITSALAPFVAGIDRPAAPSVRTLGRVHHLATPMVARLTRKAHVLSLVEALHPTPALSGFPKAGAFAWIAAHEPFDRGWYGAPVGWFDDSGQGAFAVAIRSALLTSDCTWLFAGSGIVRGSRPDAELAETRAKLATMSDALVFR